MKIKCLVASLGIFVYSSSLESKNILQVELLDISYLVPPLNEKTEKTIKIIANRKWLLIPVKNGAPKKNMELRFEGEKVYFFDIELADETPDWYAYIDIGQWKGKELELWVDNLETTSKAFNLIKQSEEDKKEEILYNELQRGQFHFSPKRGWNNDPNGLVYFNGNYHLFFQYNPFGVDWGNMHWGHAISKDLVHWEEISPALHPDEYGPMYSGGAVVDEKNTSGLGNNERPPMVLFYTAAGAWVQGLAYSQDGRHFKKIVPIISKITDGNRDPKVIWHPESQKWIMLFWVEKENQQHTIHFFNSTNLIDWTLVSIFEGGRGDDRYLFECPEFFELPVENQPGVKKWILTGANSEYAIGTFDGKVFKAEEERLNGQFGRDFYAAQTFSNEPKGRRIEIGWWRTHTKDVGANFNQSMSIPMELKLLQTSEGLRLTRTPVEELKQLRSKKKSFLNVRVPKNTIYEFEGTNAELLELELNLKLNNTKSINLDIRGVELIYDSEKEELMVDGVTAPLVVENNQLDLQIYVDRTGLEIFSKSGRFFMPININIKPEERGIKICPRDGKIEILKMDIFLLKSAWN